MSVVKVKNQIPEHIIAMLLIRAEEVKKFYESHDIKFTLTGTNSYIIEYGGFKHRGNVSKRDDCLRVQLFGRSDVITYDKDFAIFCIKNFPEVNNVKITLPAIFTDITYKETTKETVYCVVLANAKNDYQLFYSNGLASSTNAAELNCILKAIEIREKNGHPYMNIYSDSSSSVKRTHKYGNIFWVSRSQNLAHIPLQNFKMIAEKIEKFDVEKSI